MTRSHPVRFIILTLLLASSGLASVARAGDVVIEGGGKTKDVRFRIFTTFLGIRISTIVDEDLTAGTKKEYTLSPGFLTDLATEQRFINALGQDRVATNGYGFVIPDPLNPGQFTMPPLDQGLVAAIGYTEIPLPDLNNDDVDLYVFTDLAAFIGGGGVAPAVGTTISFVDGTSSLLPGVQVGLSPFDFDPTRGFVTANPFTGNAYQFGVFNLQAIPEPQSLTLGILGAISAFGLHRLLKSRREGAANR